MVSFNYKSIVLQSYSKEELWKYYLIHSMRQRYKAYNKPLSAEYLGHEAVLVRELGIDKVFIEGEADKKAYVDKSYGWTYKVKKAFNFEALCDLAKSPDYTDFKILCTYSHGTDFLTKIDSDTTHQDIMDLLTCFYLAIYRMAVTYCPDSLDEKWGEVAGKLEKRFRKHIGSMERRYGGV